LKKARSCAPRASMSARDALHIAIMERHGIRSILSFDDDFGHWLGLQRIIGFRVPHATHGGSERSRDRTNGDEERARDGEYATNTRRVATSARRLRDESRRVRGEYASDQSLFYWSYCSLVSSISSGMSSKRSASEA
jgi:hypothetical protein